MVGWKRRGRRRRREWREGLAVGRDKDCFGELGKEGIGRSIWQKIKLAKNKVEKGASKRIVSWVFISLFLQFLFAIWERDRIHLRC